MNERGSNSSNNSSGMNGSYKDPNTQALLVESNEKLLKSIIT